MRMRDAALGVFLCAALSVEGAQSPDLPAGVTRGASVEGITEYDLSNGLRVLLFPDPSKTSTTANVTYLVGSRQEDYGETGMAHLLEHLMFRGSTNHPNTKQELAEHGARSNGSTNDDRTNYFETFEGSDKNLDWALSLEADRMVNSFIAKKDLDSEMTVVRNEFEMGENNPSSILEERVLSTAYLWHNYGKSTIGARSDIEHVPIERLQAFYHRYYQPDNAVLTIAGHMDEAKTLQLVAKYFGPIPKPGRILAPTYTEEPAQDGERSVTLRRVGDDKVVMAGYHVPALANSDGPLDWLLVDVLVNAPSGRLYKALVETKKCGSVGQDTTDSREPGMMVLMATAPKSADLDDVQKTFLSVIQDVTAHTPSDDEVNRAKNEISSQLDQLMRNSERLGLFLSEYIAAGDWRLAFITRDRIAKATTAEVGQYARAYLKESNQTLGLFIPTDKPDRAEVPQPPDVLALVKGYKGNAVLAQGEAFDPSPSNIQKRTVAGQLQPGIKLVLISKKTRGEVVSGTLRFHFGDEKNLQNQRMIASLTAAMLSRGTGNHTRQQFSDELDKLKSRVTFSGSGPSVTARFQTTRENFPDVMNLIAEALRKPAFPDSEFETLKQQEITSLESELHQPQAIASLAAYHHIRPYPAADPRYMPLVDEQIAEVKAATLEQVKSYYHNFYGASNAEFSVVGDFEAESFEKQASSLYANWASPAHFHRLENPYKQVDAINRSIATPDKANAMFIAVQNIPMTDDSPDYPALTLANYMLGGGFLNSRLASRIREKEGLSYGIGTQLSVPPKDDGAVFLTYAISAPQNSAKVESAFVDELNKARQGGFSVQEVAAAKQGWLQSRQVGRNNDGELSDTLATLAFYDRTIQWVGDFEKKVAAVAPDQVNAAMRKYIDPAKMTIIKAGDFEKAKAAAAGGR